MNRLRWGVTVAVPSLAALATFAACGSRKLQSGPGPEQTTSVSTALAGLPALCTFGIYSTQTTSLADRASVSGQAGSAGSVLVGANAKVAGVSATGNVTLDSGATVNGNLVAGGTVTKQNNVTVTGTSSASAGPALPIAAPSVAFGSQVVNLFSGQTRTLPPGDYKDVHAYAGSMLTLTTGTYSLNSLVFEATSAHLILDVTQGPIAVNVAGNLLFGNGLTFALRGGTNPGAVRFYSAGTSDVVVGTTTGFLGVVVAPNALVHVMSGTTVTGALYGQGVALEPDTVVKALGCAQQDSAGAPACTVTNNGTQTALSFSTTCTGQSCPAQPLTLKETTTGVPKTGAVQVDSTFTLGGVAILKSISQALGTTVDTTVNFAPPITGVSAATFHFDGATVTGTVDGRALAPTTLPASSFNPLDPSLLHFADGRPPPALVIPPTILAGIQSLSAQAQAEIPLCDPPDDACQDCQDNCEIAAGTCDVASVAAAVACLWAYGGCLSAGLAGCTIQFGFCGARCAMAGHPCCEVPCAGGSCCNFHETCMSSGGCCADPQIICGTECCPGGITQCNQGTCCPQDTTPCGAACCGAGQQCGNPSTGLCCPAGQSACAGGCCASGQTCDPNVADAASPSVCCGPGQEACGTTCCPTGQCQPALVNEGALQVCCSTPLCGGECCNGGACVNGACCFGPVNGGGQCCGFGETVCNGQCCTGACLSDGSCCPLDQDACNNVCCASGSACTDPSTSTCTACPAGTFPITVTLPDGGTGRQCGTLPPPR